MYICIFSCRFRNQISECIFEAKNTFSMPYPVLINRYTLNVMAFVQYYHITWPKRGTLAGDRSPMLAPLHADVGGSLSAQVGKRGGVRAPVVLTEAREAA